MKTAHTVDPKFVMKRQGKDMVLYAGLVDAAHRGGLLGITTEILQFPATDNDQTTIVRAVATFPLDWIESPETGNPIAVGSRQFSGIGDANPRNVGANIAPHAIRMAETRAKARALRDALNVGMVTVEELGGDDEPHTVPPTGTRHRDYVAAHPPGPRPAKPRPEPEAAHASLSEHQRRIIAEAWDLATEHRHYPAIVAHLRPLLTDATPDQTSAIKRELAALKATHYAAKEA